MVVLVNLQAKEPVDLLALGRRQRDDDLFNRRNLYRTYLPVTRSSGVVNKPIMVIGVVVMEWRKRTKCIGILRCRLLRHLSSILYGKVVETKSTRSS